MEIFNRSALAAHYRRALPQQNTHDFLWRHCAKALQERLLDIRRDFDVVVEAAPARYVLSDTFLHQKNIAHPVNAASLVAFPEADLVLDEEAIPFAPRSLDGFISMGHLHWVNDVPGTLMQIQNALKPDGLFLSACFGGKTLHELRAVLAQAEMELYDGVSPRVSPFIGLYDMATLLQRAKFALPVADHEVITITYENVFALIRDLRGMGQTHAVIKRQHTVPSRAFWARVDELYRTQYAEKNGRIKATVEIIYALGWAPDASQPQPLKRGSATHSLVEILGRD